MYYDKLHELGIKLTKRRGSEKVQCPRCYDGRKNKNRKDLSVNIDTGEYNCHNHPCDFKGNVRVFEKIKENRVFTKVDQSIVNKNTKRKKAVVDWFANRSISEKTLERFMIFSRDNEYFPQTPDKKSTAICFPYFKEGSLVNIKFRDASKNFKMVAGAELSLFGLQFLEGKKHMIIVEGEVDALSVFECLREVTGTVDKETGEIKEGESMAAFFSKWCVVSVPNGASQGNQKLEYLDNCFEQLVDIHEFIIWTDNDVAGNELKEELTRRLGIEKCRLVNHPTAEVVPLENGLKRKCKDANEVKKYMGVDKVLEILQFSDFVPVEGIYYLHDLYPRMLERFRSGLKMGDTTRMGHELDSLLRWKKGNLNVGVGYGNWGKTTFQNQMELTKSIYDGWKWAVFCPENYPADDFYDDLVEPFVGKSLSVMTDEEYSFACRFIQDHFFYVYPEDEHDLFTIHERFRHLILKKGVDGVRIDPYNQLDKEKSQYGMTVEERVSIDLKKAKRFALHNGVVYTILAHPKNPKYNEDKSLPIVDMYDVSGGAQWGNKTDDMWSLYKPNHHIDKEDGTTQIITQKIKRKRTGGRLGMAEFYFNQKTKRYETISGDVYCDPERAEYYKGLADADRSQMHIAYVAPPSLYIESRVDDPGDDLPF